MNDIHYRFRLGKIHSSVKESPFCKLSGLGHSYSCPQHSFQNPLHHKNTAVAVNFHRVLCGVTFRGKHNAYHHFIQNITLFIRYITIMNGMAFCILQMKLTVF